MNKLKLIIQREFIARVKNKTFIIMTFLSPLLMIGMGALIVFLTKKNESKVKEIAYVDSSGLYSKEDFKDTKTVKYIDYTKLGLEEAKTIVKGGKHFGVIYLPKVDNLELLAKSVEFFSKETPGLSLMNGLESKINHKLRNLKMKELGMDEQKIKASKISSDINFLNFSGEKTSKLVNGLKGGLGMLTGVLLFMFVMFHGTSVMRSIIEEKTSRIVEIIVSSVKPFKLMMGKIIGNGSAGILQLIMWAVLLFVFSLIASSFFGIDMGAVQSANVTTEQLEAAKAMGVDKLQNILHEIYKLPLLKLFLLFIFYFIGGFMLYSSLFAAIGAAVDNEADSQQFMTPVMMPLMLGFYVGMFTVVNDAHGPVAVFFSHFPLTSPIIMLMRIPFGVAWWEILISMTLLILTFLFVIWFAAKIYRVGILMYGKKPTYKDLWKWIRYSS